ncbi:hypothetical protein KNE206_53750 [Kitasatospora sp. NE20-6]|uniref:hypothetical protein n=1 Tax=Kitasatospora sp. NE20-6 TaxID=2859066 RepID=UPI0034DC16AF
MTTLLPFTFPLGLAHLAQRDPHRDTPANRMIIQGLRDHPDVETALPAALRSTASRPAALAVAQAVVEKLIDDGRPWTQAAASWLSRADADWPTSARVCNALAWHGRMRHNSALTHMDGTAHLQKPGPDRIHTQALRHLHLAALRYDFRCRTITRLLSAVPADRRALWDPYTRALEAFALLGRSTPWGITAMTRVLDEAGDDACVAHAVLHGLWLGDGLPHHAEAILALAARPVFDPSDPVMLFRTATALRMLGRRAEALTAVQDAMEALGPNAPQFHADLVRERTLITQLPTAGNR